MLAVHKTNFKSFDRDIVTEQHGTTTKVNIYINSTQYRTGK